MDDDERNYFLSVLPLSPSPPPSPPPPSSFSSERIHNTYVLVVLFLVSLPETVYTGHTREQWSDCPSSSFVVLLLLQSHTLFFLIIFSLVRLWCVCVCVCVCVGMCVHVCAVRSTPCGVLRMCTHCYRGKKLAVYTYEKLTCFPFLSLSHPLAGVQAVCGTRACCPDQLR